MIADTPELREALLQAINDMNLWDSHKAETLERIARAVTGNPVYQSRRNWTIARVWTDTGSHMDMSAASTRRGSHKLPPAMALQISEVFPVHALFNVDFMFSDTSVATLCLPVALFVDPTPYRVEK